MRLSIIRDTWAPWEPTQHAGGPPEPKGPFRVYGYHCIDSKESDIIISDLYDPEFKLTLDYGVAVKVYDDGMQVRRRESAPYITYTTIRHIEDGGY